MLQCMKNGCDCEEYCRDKDFNLCSYCEHTPVAHGNGKFLIHITLDARGWFVNYRFIYR